jgi:flagellar basal body-associated protein FliL
MKNARLPAVMIAGTMTILFSLSTCVKAQQPFSNIQQSPTVSPYLNLLNRNNTGLPNYQTLVRPAIDQQEQNVQQQQQIQKLQHQQKSLISNSERGLAQRGISNEIRGTGHVTVFMDYSHYYARAPAGSRPQ